MKGYALDSRSLAEISLGEKAVGCRYYKPTSFVRDLSPLRYPGGKGKLAKFLALVLQTNNGFGCRYYEPFAGGAGAAFSLLINGIVEKIFINDIDPYIYAFWVSALSETERFLENILSVPLTIEEWRRQKAIYLTPKTQTIFDLGFATFYLNRCNRSGILLGAGPIGGYTQNGSWRLDARFNRESLASRFVQLGQYRKNVQIYNLDALTFLSNHLPVGNERKKVFVYLDPPYFTTGRRLYVNFFKEKNHRALAQYVLRQKTLKWIMTYDVNSFIQRTYQSCHKFILSLNYSLQRKHQANELMITPKHLRMPSDCELSKLKINLQKI